MTEKKKKKKIETSYLFYFGKWIWYIKQTQAQVKQAAFANERTASIAVGILGILSVDATLKSNISFPLFKVQHLAGNSTSSYTPEEFHKMIKKSISKKQSIVVSKSKKTKSNHNWLLIQGLRRTDWNFSFPLSFELPNTFSTKGIGSATYYTLLVVEQEKNSTALIREFSCHRQFYCASPMFFDKDQVRATAIPPIVDRSVNITCNWDPSISPATAVYSIVQEVFHNNKSLQKNVTKKEELSKNFGAISHNRVINLPSGLPPSVFSYNFSLTYRVVVRLKTKLGHSLQVEIPIILSYLPVLIPDHHFRLIEMRDRWPISESFHRPGWWDYISRVSRKRSDPTKKLKSGLSLYVLYWLCNLWTLDSDPQWRSSLAEIGRICCVCKKWNRLGNTDVLWKQIYQQKTGTAFEGMCTKEAVLTKIGWATAKKIENRTTEQPISLFHHITVNGESWSGAVHNHGAIYAEPEDSLTSEEIVSINGHQSNILRNSIPGDVLKRVEVGASFISVSFPSRDTDLESTTYVFTAPKTLELALVWVTGNHSNRATNFSLNHQDKSAITFQDSKFYCVQG